MVSLKEKLATDAAQSAFARLYGNTPGTIDKQIERYGLLIDEFEKCFSANANKPMLLSAPGRAEICGNHTDHNHGRVLAAAVNLDTIAVTAPVDENKVTLYSKGYEQPFVVDLNNLSPQSEEQGTTESLIRGVATDLQARGYQIGGFQACVESEVGIGSGLSSSAAFEVLVGTIFNHLYNEGRIEPKEIALAGQHAENKFFGKPSGLMDQIASAVGGFVMIDFANPSAPEITPVDFDLNAAGLSIVITDTGGSHANLTNEYASIQSEMQAVARALGGNLLRDVSEQTLIERAAELRQKVNDRALLRAFHFFSENDRVAEMMMALRDGDLRHFQTIVNQSGRSSWMLLQNCYVPGDTEQSLAYGLALSELVLSGRGAWRVHGGGFAGTILAFVPNETLNQYIKCMETAFSKNKAKVLHLREAGAVKLDLS